MSNSRPIRMANGHPRLQGTGQQVCHVRIADVAKAAAGELYERQMGDNLFYEEWKRQNPGATPKQLEERFIKRNWGKCIDFARKTLTMMLTRDDIAESMKDEIMVILEQDQILRNRRVFDPRSRVRH